MNDQYWSWILTAVGLVGFYFAGRKVWWCWYINIACQALWFAYAMITEQYGFLVASLVYTWIFAENALSWTQEHSEKTALAEAEQEFSKAVSTSVLTPNEARFAFQNVNIKFDAEPFLKAASAIGKNLETFKREIDLASPIVRCRHYDGKGKQLPCPPTCPRQSWPRTKYKRPWFGKNLKRRNG